MSRLVGTCNWGGEGGGGWRKNTLPREKNIIP